MVRRGDVIIMFHGVESLAHLDATERITGMAKNAVKNLTVAPGIKNHIDAIDTIIFHDLMAHKTMQAYILAVNSWTTRTLDRAALYPSKDMMAEKARTLRIRTHPAQVLINEAIYALANFQKLRLPGNMFVTQTIQRIRGELTAADWSIDKMIRELEGY